MQHNPALKETLISICLALLAALICFGIWNAVQLGSLHRAFIYAGAANNTRLDPIPTLVAITLVSIVSLATALAIGKFGAKRAAPALSALMLALAFISLLLSGLAAIDIEYTALLFAVAGSAVTVQARKLAVREKRFTTHLTESAKRLTSPEEQDAHARLLSGLKLLETVLKPTEAIVFRRDSNNRLVSAARLRASFSGQLDVSRNSVWRDGVSLSERAINENSLVAQSNNAGVASTSIALPLRHESHTVGALLIRTVGGFEDNDRGLLLAVGTQLARNLQREHAVKSQRLNGSANFLSAREADKKLESLYVLNGLLHEQRFGIESLEDISDGLGIAYLDGTIAYVNDNLLEYAGLTRESVVGFNLFSLLDRFRIGVFDEPSIAVRRVLQTGETYERELKFPEKNVTYGLRIELIRSGSETAKDQSLCLAIHVTDVTSAKEHEQLKSDMISLMSHELRTPLTSINGFAELLTADKDLPEQAKEFVAIIATESQRLSRMINTFLAVTQLQRKDKQEVLKIPLRLDEVARDIVTTLQPAAKKRRIRLVEQPAPRLPPVAADKSLIMQAVKNLVSNAIKYSPERTTVTVSTSLEAEAVRVSVEDRGYGIPSEARERVWEKFYRVAREGQDKDDESTGLGLSFVREVVEQHGGRVELESQEGRGSKFSFTLPRL